ncbi:unnamed protein product [Sphagnum balticum]
MDGARVATFVSHAAVTCVRWRPAPVIRVLFISGQKLKRSHYRIVAGVSTAPLAAATAASGESNGGIVSPVSG